MTKEINVPSTPKRVNQLKPKHKPNTREITSIQKVSKFIEPIKQDSNEHSKNKVKHFR